MKDHNAVILAGLTAAIFSLIFIIMFIMIYR